MGSHQTHLHPGEGRRPSRSVGRTGGQGDRGGLGPAGGSVQLTLTRSPGSYPASAAVTSSAEVMVSSPIAVITSPAVRPAVSAGPPETVPATEAPSVVPEGSTEMPRNAG